MNEYNRLDEDARDWIVEYNEEALLANGFEEAFIGMCHRFGQEPLVAYDRDKCIDILMSDFAEGRENLETSKGEEVDLYEEAVDYFEYNVIGAWVGDTTPVFITKYSE